MNTQNPTHSLSLPSLMPFPGGHIPAAEKFGVLPSDMAASEVDYDYVRRVAHKPDGDKLVEEHHRTLFTRDTADRTKGISDARDRDADLVAAGYAECARLKANLEKIGEEFIRTTGGSQTRTIWTWVLFYSLIILAIFGLYADYLLLHHLVADVAPELLNAYDFMIPTAALVLFAVVAMKCSAMLADPDRTAYVARCRLWSKWLPWAAIPLLLALAWRYHQLSSSPGAQLLSDDGGWHDALGLAIFFIQLAAQAAVATGAVLAGEYLLWETRPERTIVKPEYAAAKATLASETRLLEENRNSLSLCEQKLGAINADLGVLLNRASAALEEERREQRATQLEIDALRRSHN